MQNKSLRHTKRKPTHPGAILREDILPTLNITGAKLAKFLRINSFIVYQLLREKRRVTPDVAMRIALLTSTTPESWLHMQDAFDLWKLEQHPEKYKLIEPIYAEA